MTKEERQALEEIEKHYKELSKELIELHKNLDSKNLTDTVQKEIERNDEQAIKLQIAKTLGQLGITDGIIKKLDKYLKKFGTD